MTTLCVDGVVRIYQGRHVVGGGVGLAEFRITEGRLRVHVCDVVRFAQVTIETPAFATLTVLRDPISMVPLEGVVSWSRMGVPSEGPGHLHVDLCEEDSQEDSQDAVSIWIQLGDWALRIRVSRAALDGVLLGLEEPRTEEFS